jgi:myosin heavy subunit
MWKEATEDGFDKLGFENEEVMGVFRTVSAVLLLGNLVIEGKSLPDFDSGTDICEIMNQDKLKDIADLLKIQPNNGKEGFQLLEEELLNRPFNKAVGVRQPEPKEACIDQRNTLAKFLYNRLFCWIVHRTN